jgi:hypothetical protein
MAVEQRREMRYHLRRYDNVLDFRETDIVRRWLEIVHVVRKESGPGRKHTTGPLVGPDSLKEVRGHQGPGTITEVAMVRHRPFGLSRRGLKDMAACAEQGY